MPRRSVGCGFRSSFAKTYEAQNELLDHLKNACFSDKFSDMKVRLSNGEEINCHRIIVCAQCDFFDNAIKEGRFQEGQTGIIDMPNDPPHAVTALLEFFYKGGYTLDADLDICDNLLFHIDVMNVAAVYRVELLEDIGAGRIYSCLNNSWEAIIPIVPEIFSMFEQLYSPDRSAWSPHMLNALFDGALDHADLLLETETWEGLWKYARKFMEEITSRMKKKWVRQVWYTEEARKWLTKVLGAEAIRVVECPHNFCIDVKEGLILSEEKPRTWECCRCGAEMLLDDCLPMD